MELFELLTVSKSFLEKKHTLSYTCTSIRYLYMPVYAFKMYLLIILVAPTPVYFIDINC